MDIERRKVEGGNALLQSLHLQSKSTGACGWPRPCVVALPHSASLAKARGLVALGVIAKGSEEPRWPGRALGDSPGPQPPVAHTAYKSPRATAEPAEEAKQE